MRFDPERVVALADAWNDLRQGPSGGERRVADEIAGSFERAGLRVARIESESIDHRPRALALVLAICLGLEMGFRPADLSIPARFGLIGLILATLLVAAGWVGRRARRSGRSRGSQHVIGQPVREDQPPARVVLLTRLDATRPEWRGAWMWLLWGVFGSLGLILCSPAYARELHRIPVFGLDLIFGQWLTAFWIVLYPTWAPPWPIRGENPMGLALLAELALTWPRSVGDRVETWFVATPDPCALSRALPGILGGRPDTLVVELDAPGVGPDLIIADYGPAARLARAAARDLWIPHRLSWMFTGLFLQTFSKSKMLVVRLRGARDDSPINPALLAATAQLVTEIGLRWAKQAVKPTQPESLAKSSQNPG